MFISIAKHVKAVAVRLPKSGLKFDRADTREGRAIIADVTNGVRLRRPNYRTESRELDFVNCASTLSSREHFRACYAAGLAAFRHESGEYFGGVKVYRRGENALLCSMAFNDSNLESRVCGSLETPRTAALKIFDRKPEISRVNISSLVGLDNEKCLSRRIQRA